ncbi:MAG: hypothetical protein QY330_01215 [Candidatus Dojkabacteria bacterium]|nr:MAG: hypothetical protein QY330_01215 [Candidatus Dojkabacteria bacterium]
MSLEAIVNKDANYYQSVLRVPLLTSEQVREMAEYIYGLPDYPALNSNNRYYLRKTYSLPVQGISPEQDIDQIFTAIRHPYCNLAEGGKDSGWISLALKKKVISAHTELANILTYNGGFDLLSSHPELVIFKRGLTPRNENSPKTGLAQVNNEFFITSPPIIACYFDEAGNLLPFFNSLDRQENYKQTNYPASVIVVRRADFLTEAARDYFHKLFANYGENSERLSSTETN